MPSPADRRESLVRIAELYRIEAEIHDSRLFGRVALCTVFYNFVRINQAVKTAPAMAAGVSKTLWTMDYRRPDLRRRVQDRPARPLQAPRCI